jgi:regulator of CtrA degradation
MFARCGLWHQANMQLAESQPRLTRKVIDSLYVEAMVLADEARAYFDQFSKDERKQLDPVLRVSFSCESLKVTTRLMHIIAWLLTRRAVDAGELDPMQALSPSLRLGVAVASDAALLDRLPDEARLLVDSSVELYTRVKRLDARLLEPGNRASPARSLMAQLERAF